MDSKTEINFVNEGHEEGCHIANACDVVRNLEIWYNDVMVESINDCNAWANALIAHSANDSWVASEGQALLGYTFPGVSNFDTKGGALAVTAIAAATVAAGTTVDVMYSKSRVYSVPLSLLSGFCRMAP